MLETGSSLLYPLMNLWIASYQAQHPDVQITTQSTGSGTGIAQAMGGVAQIGASDAYMPTAAVKKTGLLNLPVVVSAQLIDYNIPGLRGRLRLSGPLLAGMFAGSIAYWDDPRILAINPQLRGELPHQRIVPIHRSDGSGDTFIFTQYLSQTTPSWSAGPSFGTSVSWPAVDNGVGSDGNPGVLQACQNTRYSIAYIGISFMDEVVQANLGIALLRNRSGAYVAPSFATISRAAAAFQGEVPADERISLIDAPGAISYPLINYEYFIVNPHQPNQRVREALKDFLTWVLSPQGGQRREFLDVVHFLRLPAATAALSRKRLGSIHA
jgi:phosphate transport system substrate-binding protein